jgi:hypothetical protein
VVPDDSVRGNPSLVQPSEQFTAVVEVLDRRVGVVKEVSRVDDRVDISVSSLLYRSFEVVTEVVASNA